MNNCLTYFISDLHLSESTDALNKAFDDFLDFCLSNPPKQLFILGDLFDYYLGFDVIGEWGQHLANKIAKLTQKDIALFFLPGNRDFLIDKTFLKAAKLTLLPDPYLCNFNGHHILLSHGDRYCTNDKYHQIFRSISQSRFIKYGFLWLPKSFRLNIALKVRKKGRDRTLSENEIMPVDEEMILSLKKNNASTLVHGHIHRPQVCEIPNSGASLKQVVLPDWREVAEFVEYDELKNQFTFKTV